MGTRQADLKNLETPDKRPFADHYIRRGPTGGAETKMEVNKMRVLIVRHNEAAEEFKEVRAVHLEIGTNRFTITESDFGGIHVSDSDASVFETARIQRQNRER